MLLRRAGLAGLRLATLSRPHWPPHPASTRPLALLGPLAAVLLPLLVGVGMALPPPVQERAAALARTTINWRPAGTYVLDTLDRESIRAYYRDVRMGPLILTRQGRYEAMRETCLLLGEHWRPLGYVEIPNERRGRTYEMELCHYAAANPEHLARAKCANLGMALLENRPHRREIVCELPRWVREAAEERKRA